MSVVIPVRNEAATIEPLLAQLREAFATGHDFEVVLVDDGSSDGTWTEIQLANELDTRVRGLSLSRNFGKDAAIFAGLREARGDAVIVMDGDLQHPPKLLPDMVARWESGEAELVVATKQSRAGQPGTVRLGAKLFNRSFLRLTGVDLTDATDLRLLSRRAVEALLELPERTLFFRGTSAWIGFPTVSVPFDVQKRAQGGSTFTLRLLIRYAIRSLTAFTSAPLHLVTLLGALFGVLSAVLGIQTLARWMRGDAVEGFTTVILLLLITGSAILVGLGIIGEYLARIHEEVKGRPRYLIANRTPDDLSRP